MTSWEILNATLGNSLGVAGICVVYGADKSVAIQRLRRKLMD
jgi:hypothetical protein